MELPEEYLKRMRQILKDAFPAYLASLEEERVRSLRVNTGKIQPDRLRQLLPFLGDAVEWCPEGIYIRDGNLSKHPYYGAGLYYLQEASAMAPGAFLPVEPGDWVLDLCGAPGGKATQLGVRLGGTGLLAANDISASRAQAMVKNLELFGIPNCLVTAEPPDRLAAAFPESFHKILVDAPCSGEGMFRRDASLVRDWERRGPQYYQPLQREILSQAVSMLRPGGQLLYSTCTFSLEEDEENVCWLLHTFPDLALVPLPPEHGICAGEVPGTLRLWPHRVRGEGHFLALFRKQSAEEGSSGAAALSSRLFASAPRFKGADDRGKTLSLAQAAPEFAPLLGPRWQTLPLTEQRDNLYWLPPGFPHTAGLRCLRTGLLLGSRKKGRFQPSQAWAMALRQEDFGAWVDYSPADTRVLRYLKGETITCQDVPVSGPEGWVLVCAGGFPLGWAKRSGDTLKNKYNPGWRWQ